VIAIPFSQIGNIHQYATIAANSSGRVFYLKIPESTVGFLQKAATNWFNNTYYSWAVDGAIVESKIERMLASITEPQNFEPPYLVKNNIEFIAFNNDTESHVFEVLCDGICYQKRRI